MPNCGGGSASLTAQLLVDTPVMALDPHTPVIVGVAQVTDRVDDPTGARSALDLMEDALLTAGSDSGCGAAVGNLDAIGVVGGLWRYTDPGRQLADRVGADPATTLLTSWSGHSPQLLLNHLAAGIQAGEIRSAAVIGGETNRSRRLARTLGLEYRRDYDTTLPAAEAFGEPLVMATSHEEDRGVDAPVTIYPLLDSAIRHAMGESISGHRSRLGTLWEGFNRVAVDNPHAAVRTPMTADEITTPTETNRLVGAPYTIAMNAHNNVDQASAVLLMSAERASAAGVPRDRWVFPLAGSNGFDTEWISERWDLHRAPVLRLAGERALTAAGTGVGDLTHIDLYSCFPSAVQISSTELGIDQNRTLTVTGGLTFAGAAYNNYSGQAIAAMVGCIREQPGTGLVHANGGYVTKHAFGVYSDRPGAHFTNIDVADKAASLPKRRTHPGFSGEAKVEAYSVMHDRIGLPTHAVVSLRTGAEARVWGTTRDSGLVGAMLIEEHVGRSAELSPDGSVSV